MPVCVMGSYDSGTNEKLAKILSKLEKITEELGLTDDISEVASKDLCLYRRGKMFWWTEIDDAFMYRIKLSIAKLPVAIIELDRNTRYYTFKDIEGLGIFNIQLEVENRDGRIIRKINMNF